MRNEVVLSLSLVLLVGGFATGLPVDGDGGDEIGPQIMNSTHTPPPTVPTTTPVSTTPSSLPTKPTPPPNTTTPPSPTTPPSSTTPPTSTIPATTTTTDKPPTTPNPVTTTSPVSSTTSTPPPPTTEPPHRNSFNGPSFIGGIVMTLGLVAIGFVGWKYYKARTERNYRTL